MSAFLPTPGPDWVCPPTERQELAAERLVRAGWGVIYLDNGGWHILGPNDPVEDGAGTKVGTSLMLAMAKNLPATKTP